MLFCIDFSDMKYYNALSKKSSSPERNIALTFKNKLSLLWNTVCIVHCTVLQKNGTSTHFLIDKDGAIFKMVKN